MNRHLAIDIVTDALGTAYLNGGFSSMINFAQGIEHGSITGYDHLPGMNLALAQAMTHALRGQLGQATVRLQGNETGQLISYRDSLTGK